MVPSGGVDSGRHCCLSDLTKNMLTYWIMGNLELDQWSSGDGWGFVKSQGSQNDNSPNGS